MGKMGTHSGNVGHTHSQSNSRILGSKEVEGGDGDDVTHGVRRRRGKERRERGMERDHLWRSQQPESTNTQLVKAMHSTATACSTT